MNRVSDAAGPTSPEAIRNVVLVGASGAGKTALFDQLVAARIPGRRAREGVSASTTSLVAASVPTGEVTLNLLDTPGHPDFVGEVRAGLRAADAALFVVSAADGVDEATRLLWRECEVLGMPRAVAVTRLEQARADFEATVDACQRAFGDAEPLALPLLVDGAVAGLLNLLRRTVTEQQPGGGEADREPSADEGELIDAQRGELIESVIEESEDEGLLERYLEGEEVDTDAVSADLRLAIATARFFPVLPTHAPNAVGVEALIELCEKGFPSPVGSAVPTVYTPAGGDFGAVTCDPEGPLVAEVVHTTTDPFVGRQSLVRVFSGTLRPDEPVHISGHLQHFATHLVDEHADHDTDDERIGPLSSPVAEETRPIGAGIAGDIVVVSKLSGAETSDTLSRKGRPALVEPWLLPNPLLPVAIHARSKGDEDKLATALQRLVAEDVTMRLEHNAETHQLVLWAMGPAHVDQLIAHLESRYHVPVEVEEVRTSLRETFVRPTKVQGRLVKQSGGHGQYAVCHLEIEPLERGVGDRVRRQGGRRCCAAQLHPVRGEGRPHPAGPRCPGRLPGGRRPDHPGRRQGALGRLLRHGLPDRRRDGACGRRPTTPPSPCSNRSTRCTSTSATTPSAGCWPTCVGVAGRCTAPSRRTCPAARSSTRRCPPTSWPATRSTCVRSRTARGRSPAASCATTTCRPPWPGRSPRAERASPHECSRSRVEQTCADSADRRRSAGWATGKPRRRAALGLRQLSSHTHANLGRTLLTWPPVRVAGERRPGREGGPPSRPTTQERSMRNLRKIALTTVAVGALATAGVTSMASTASATTTSSHGCPSGAVCIYPGASWSGTPKMYWSYGAHNLSGQYGTKRIFNNQTGGATMRTCTGYNGTGCQGYLPAGWYIDKDVTPINSIVLVRP